MNWKELKIPFDVVSVVAKGRSVWNVPRKTWERLKKETFVIALNDSPAIGHLRIWMDGYVGKQLKGKEKTELYITSDDNEYKDLADYTFDWQGPGLNGHYTITTILMLLKRDHAKKNIFLFGADFVKSDPHSASFDMDGNIIKIEKPAHYPGYLDECKRKIEVMADENQKWAQQIFNCSERSTLNCFKRLRYA